MAFKIIVSKTARKDTEKIINYLVKEWSSVVAKKFVTNLDTHLDSLISFPYVGTLSKTKLSVRCIVITKHNKLYYRVENDKVYVLKIIDTRQNPVKNWFE